MFKFLKESPFYGYIVLYPLSCLFIFFLHIFFHPKKENKILYFLYNIKIAQKYYWYVSILQNHKLLPSIFGLVSPENTLLHLK